MKNEQKTIKESLIVSARQMREIESRIFERGMPVSALMEKAAGLCFQKIIILYPLSKVSRVGVIVGSGHNGGDALVIARELYLAGYQIKIYRPLTKLKELTAAHAKYVASLKIPFSEEITILEDCDLIVDGLFGFGLERSLDGKIAEAVDKLNTWHQPIVSIDLPSGIHTDTGEPLGTAVKATHTLCLGLWKRAFFQDAALEYIGKATKLDFGITEADLQAIIPEHNLIQQITPQLVRQFLPLPRLPVTHKYQQGSLLLVSGSRRYGGAAILNALGARASGVGMLSVAVPESLRQLLISQLPEALIIGCPETPSGAIDSLPLSDAELAKFDTIGGGSGLTAEAQPIIERILTCCCPLILDADALNIIAQLQKNDADFWQTTPGVRIITPHLGEFKRLFPNINYPEQDRIKTAQQAAINSNTIVLFKGARTIVAHHNNSVWIIPESTPALARGGSGDILTGLLSGLIAQQKNNPNNIFNTVAVAAYWHAQAGIKAAQERTELGVDAFTLSSYLSSVFRNNHFTVLTN
jgi:ADP-dependent NAD(P)H-hydrate dehydratase / NAD(P)H-hydrate epimerase